MEGAQYKEGKYLMSDAIILYTSVMAAAIPYAVSFMVGNMIVSTFLNAAFGGKFSFKIGG